MNDPAFVGRMVAAVRESKELDWLSTTFAYTSGVPFNETPITNFRNYRYKIVEIFKMTYKQEKAVLDVEIATPDMMVVLGTFIDYRLKGRLLVLNSCIVRNEHSWQKLLALAKHDVRLLVNVAFITMHLFAGDIMALGENDIVTCYILAAAVISTMDKASRNRWDRDIQKQGLKRPQPSITDRQAQTPKIPKDSSRAESAYCKEFTDILLPSTADKASTPSDPRVIEFTDSAKQLSTRKQCLEELAQIGKDLPQLGRLLHLGRTENVEPQPLAYYIGQDKIAMPATKLGDHRYKKPDSRNSGTKRSSLW